MKNKSILASISIFLLVMTMVGMTQAAVISKNSLTVEHKVSIESLGEQLFRINTSIKNINKKETKILFPMYRPGIYTTYYYFKSVGDLSITNAEGGKLKYKMPSLQTFIIDTDGIDQVNISFYYRATKLSSNEAFLDKDLGFFTGVQFFIMVDDQKDIKSKITIDVPKGWKILTTLDATKTGNTFTADDYDELADSQTMIGSFDVTRFQNLGKENIIATSPSGFYSAENTEKLKEKIKGITKVHSDIFGELPYDKFTYFYIFRESPAANTSEFLSEIQSANSHLHIVEPNPDASKPESVLASIIHNHFHAWSLMRMRPTENWNWDYTKNVDSRLLWLTEGITRYYMTITRHRSNNGTVNDFMFRVNESINGVELKPSRKILSPADASILADVRFEGLLETDYSFVRGGHVVGLLLDLSIRKDTSSQHSLDDAMRILYEESYKKNRGYTSKQFQKIIENLTKHSYQEFFDNYIDGTEVPPYDKILGYAGYRLNKRISSRPVLGIVLGNNSDGVVINRVLRESVAEESGLKREDIILNFGTLDVAKNGLAGAGQIVAANVDKSIPLKVKRDGKIEEIQLNIRNVPQEQYEVIPVQEPTDEQLSLRDKWLKQ